MIELGNWSFHRFWLWNASKVIFTKGPNYLGKSWQHWLSFVLSGPEKVKLEELVNVSLSAAYEEGTLVAQATLSLPVRYMLKKSLNIFLTYLVKLIYKKNFFSMIFIAVHTYRIWELLLHYYTKN